MSTIISIGARTDNEMKYDKKPSKRVNTFTVYAHVSDMNEFAQATYHDNRVTHYVELADKFDDITMMVTDISASQYEMVVRTGNTNGLQYTDTTTLISKDVFDALSSASDTGYKYKYYKFPILGTDEFWEVCVYMDKSGADHPWVRCEIYIDDTSDIAALPFKAEEFFVWGDPETLTSAKALIDSLWSREYSKIDNTDVLVT